MPDFLMWCLFVWVGASFYHELLKKPPLGLPIIAYGCCVLIAIVGFSMSAALGVGLLTVSPIVTKIWFQWDAVQAKEQAAAAVEAKRLADEKAEAERIENERLARERETEERLAADEALRRQKDEAKAKRERILARKNLDTRLATMVKAARGIRAGADNSVLLNMIDDEARGIDADPLITQEMQQDPEVVEQIGFIMEMIAQAGIEDRLLVARVRKVFRWEGREGTASTTPRLACT